MIGIICLTGRCGSTSLLTALVNSLNLSFISEPFNKSNVYQPDWILNVTSKNLVQTLKQQNIQIFKHILYQSNDNKKIISDCDKVIFMYRANFLDYILSNFFSSTYFDLSGQHCWHKHDRQYKFFELMRPPTQLEHISSLFTETQQRLSYFSHFLSISNIEHKFVSYEDFYTESVLSNFHDLCDFLELTPLNESGYQFLSPENKLNNQETFEKLIPNFSEAQKFKNLILKI